MRLLAHNSFTKSLFIFFWLFFIIRTTSYIDIENNIFEFNLENWFNFFSDLLSIFILIILLIYLLYFIITNKRIPISIILIFYPISGVLGYLNNIELHNNNFYIWHHFITLISIIIFLTIINSYKIFNFHFYILLLKILIFVLFVYFLLNLLPIIIFKIYNNLDLRHTYEGNIFLLNFINISINQNVNGQARILFVLQLFFLILFKKYSVKRKSISNIFFFISALLIFIVFLMQSRFIIVSSCIFSFFIVVYNHGLNFKKKLFYLFFLIITITSAASLTKLERFLENNNKNIFKYNKIQNFNLGTNSLYESNEQYSLSQCSVDINVNKIDAFLSGRVCGWEILIKNLNNDLLFGKGFFADQILLKSVQKISSNSWLNILFNSGVLSLIIILLFLTAILFKHFKIKNIHHQNIYICLSYYLVIFILCRSLLEDTIVFLNIDLMILIISLLIMKNSKKKLLLYYKNK
jgi:hypothetical protein